MNPSRASGIVTLIGAGPMAIEYAKVLKALDIGFHVHGRGAASAEKFEAATGVTVGTGDLAGQLAGTSPASAIIAVGVQDLAETTALLCRHGCKSILVEKPAARGPDECRKLVNSLEGTGFGNVLVAYNRRFYPGVQRVAQMIAEDGGATSVQFRFTELAWKLAGIEKDPRVKANWLYANSTHVIDMAFHLAGWPKFLKAAVSGGLSWHPAGSRFVGHGETKTGALFSYHADWDAPGGWGVEVLTRKHRLIFQPLETLQVQEIGSFDVETVDLSPHPRGANLKPGLAEMTEAFIAGEAAKVLPDLEEQVAHFDIYETILRGGEYSVLAP